MVAAELALQWVVADVTALAAEDNTGGAAVPLRAREDAAAVTSDAREAGVAADGTRAVAAVCSATQTQLVNMAAR